MGARKGLGCSEHPRWGSVMVPVWMGWWLPRLHWWLHARFRHSAGPVGEGER